MSDLDALRRALQAPPDEPFGPVDIDKIMSTGKRIRRRRRAVIGAGAVLATAAVLVGVTTFTLQPPAQVPPAQQTTLPTVTEPVAAPPKAQPFGEVIRTGVMQGDEELVFYFFAINSADLPMVHFGIAAGRMSSSGYLRGGIANNDFHNENGDRAGFHHIMGGSDDTGTFTPAFGYYVGPAARIESRVLGKTVRANVTPWSEDPNVKLFWFTEGVVPDAELLGRPTAYDSMGNRLP
jgi:hypothetical protein